jgi:signal transduction histidine kinase
MRVLSPAVGAAACLTAARRLATAAAYLVPPAIGAASLGLVMTAGDGFLESTGTRAALGAGLVLVGLATGAVTGCAASAAERRTVEREYEQRLDDLDHDLRAPMTIIRGEVELVLGADDVPPEERQRSSATVIEQIEALEAMLRRRSDAGGSGA